MSELKLEVGKKYNLDFGSFSLNPFIFVADDGEIFVFKNKNGGLVTISKDKLPNIIEHREPKRSFEGWFNVYDEEVAQIACFSAILDEITNLKTGNTIYSTKNKAANAVTQLDHGKQMYGKFTFEEITDVAE